MRVGPDKVRLPDVVYLGKENDSARHNRVWDGADLVMEIVSDDDKDRQRDYQAKSAEYAAAGIAEYWIVDPHERCVLVNRLEGQQYALAGKYSQGAATSVLLPEFSVDVAELFAVIDDVVE